jgi:hypothetical protein
MLKKREHHRILALLFAALYLFVALFSQNFHNHGSGEIYKDYHFKKAEKTFSANTKAAEYTDCLSCHILHDGKYAVPEQFFFSFGFTEIFQVPFFQKEKKVSQFSYFNLQLRGPPAHFI